MDAEVEVCDDDTPTGRLIKLQIKAGKHWFREQNDTGVVFRDSREHFDYWLNHSLPVVLTLYDPITDTVRWVEVDHNQVEYTRKGCKIIVPKGQILSPSSTRSLKVIASKGAHFSPPTKTDRHHIFQMFGKAKTSIHVVTFALSRHFRDALSIASRRVHVRIVVGESDEVSIKELTGFIHQEPLLDVRATKDLHTKLIVIDEKIGIYGSSVHGTMSSHNEVVVEVTNEENVRSLVRNFDQIWESSCLI